MGIFDSGRAALAAAAELAAEEITLVPASGGPVSLRARVGSKLFRTYDDGGVPVAVTVRRFIVRAAELDSMPTNADSIVWRDRRFRLGNPDGGAPWRFHGNDNTDIAIYATDFGPAT